MESVIIETLDCPLDFNLSQSWEKDTSLTHTSYYSKSTDEETEIKLEDDLIEQIKNLSFANALDSNYNAPKCSNEISEINSQEKDTSGYSESSDEETEIKHDYSLIEQIKNLSFANASESKCITPKYTNETSEIDPQEKDNSGERILMDNKEIEEIQSCSSSLKYKEPLKFVEKDDDESTFHKCPNRNCEIYSKKKNNIEKQSFEENWENVENQLSSLSLKNNKILNKYNKSGSDSSDEDKSDSDDDYEQVESVILRERDPTRRNRSQTNKQQRTAPFTRNPAKTSKPPFNLNSFQTFGNSSPPVSYGFNTFQDGYDSIRHLNSQDLATDGNVYCSSSTLFSGFLTSESETNQMFRDILSTTATDEVPERVVPSIEFYENLNVEFYEETNGTSSLDHSKGRRFVGYAATNVEKETYLDSCLVENLSEEEVENLLSSQNPKDLLCPLPLLSNEDVENVFNSSSALNQNKCAESTVKKVSYSKNNHPNFQSEPYHRHSSFLKSNAGNSTSNYLSSQNPLDLLCPLTPLSKEDIEFFSNSSIPNQNIYVESTLAKINHINNNQQSFHSEPDQSPSYFSKVNVEESGNYSNSVIENISSINCESSSPETSDYERFSKEMEDEIKKILNNGDKIRNNNQTCKASCKIEEPKIYTVYGTAARDMLFNSPSFCKRKWKHENEEIRNLMKKGELGTEEKTVIHMLKKNRRTKYRGTNLHYAIREDNIEKVYCLVECHKECHGGLGEINMRDNSDKKKTVLDYSKEKGFHLLTAYLEENMAKSYSNICN